MTATESQTAGEALELLDWKRRIFELYAGIRTDPDPARASERWRATRDELFRSHRQSPLPPAERESYPGAPCFAYDPAFRVTAVVEPLPSELVQIGSSGTEPVLFDRIGRVTVVLGGEECSLDVFWLVGYGGGLFLPFRDATAGRETYGAGRYLLDTVKGSDLGMEGERLVLDFNFAYNPSCSYDPRWVCPLAPPANRLAVDVRAGERMPG
jgi:uncharacterized protein (DUF1684 family)